METAHDQVVAAQKALAKLRNRPLTIDQELTLDIADLALKQLNWKFGDNS